MHKFNIIIIYHIENLFDNLKLCSKQLILYIIFLHCKHKLIILKQFSNVFEVKGVTFYFFGSNSK